MEVAKVHFPKAELIERQVGDYKFKSQVGYLKINEHVSHEIQVRAPDNGQPYPAGVYLIGAESFRTDDYGRLTVSKRGIVLVPEKVGAK
jgi:Helix-destabilising protein